MTELGPFLRQQISRTTRNLFLLNGFLIAAVIWFSFQVENVIYDSISGPQIVDVEYLNSKRAADSSVYIQVKGEQTFETGVEKVSQSTDKHGAVTNHLDHVFVVTSIGGRFLVVKAKPQSRVNLYFTGIIVPFEEESKRSIVAALDKADPKYAANIYPYVLDATYSVAFGTFLLIFFCPLLLVTFYNLIKAILRMADPLKHPIARRYLKYKATNRPPSLNDDEFTRDVKKFGRKLALTKEWFWNKTKFDLQIAPLSKIVWAYRKITSKSFNGIPTGKEIKLFIHTNEGEIFEIDSSDKHSENFMAHLPSIAPWITLGFSDELKVRWRKDRAAFIQAVEARKKPV